MQRCSGAGWWWLREIIEDGLRYKGRIGVKKIRSVTGRLSVGRSGQSGEGEAKSKTRGSKRVREGGDVAGRRMKWGRRYPAVRKKEKKGSNGTREAERG